MYDVGNPCPGMGQTQQYTMVNWLMGSQTVPLNNWNMHVF